MLRPRQSPSRAHQQAALFRAEDVVEYVARAEDRYVLVKFRLVIEPLKDRRVWIGAELVAVDYRIGIAGGHLVVTRIGKLEAVGDLRDAAFVLVAVNLALLGDDGPEERHQRFAARFGRVAPKILA